MFERRLPLSSKYNEYILKGLDKAYFNEQPDKFTLLQKYTEGAEKEFLFVYKNRKLGHNFGVFIPTDIERVEDRSLSPVGTKISTVAAFIKKFQKQLEAKNVEFLLVPVTDFEHMHWTLLKISLKKDKQLDVEYYDPSIIKKLSIADHIKGKLKNTFNQLNFSHKFTVWVQVEDINCGPFVHRMIQHLANKLTPDIAPKTGIVERIKDANLLNAIRDKDDPQNPQYVELEQNTPRKPPLLLGFLVKHRRKIYAAVLIAAVAVSIGLLIAFPPAGVAGLVATGVAAAGSTGVAIGVASGGIAVVGTIIAAIGFGIAKLAKVLSRSKKSAENQKVEVINWTPTKEELAESAPKSQAEVMGEVIIPSKDVVKKEVETKRAVTKVETPDSKKSEVVEEDNLDMEGFVDVPGQNKK